MLEVFFPTITYHAVSATAKSVLQLSERDAARTIKALPLSEATVEKNRAGPVLLLCIAGRRAPRALYFARHSSYQLSVFVIFFFTTVNFFSLSSAFGYREKWAFSVLLVAVWFSAQFLTRNCVKFCSFFTFVQGPWQDDDEKRGLFESVGRIEPIGLMHDQERPHSGDCCADSWTIAGHSGNCRYVAMSAYGTASPQSLLKGAAEQKVVKFLC